MAIAVHGHGPYVTSTMVIGEMVEKKNKLAESKKIGYVNLSPFVSPDDE